jgi:hypothetical protein
LKNVLSKYEDEIVEHKGEPTCDQDEITNLRRENMLLKEKLSQSIEEKEEIIKFQIEEAKVTHELTERHLKENDQML